MLLALPSDNVPAPDLIKPPAPVIAPLNTVVLAPTEKVLLVPVNVTALASVMPALVETSVELLPTLLFSVSAPAAVRLDNAVKSKVTRPAPDGMSEIVAPALPKACASVLATSEPAVIFVKPV